jgi:transposase
MKKGKDSRPRRRYDDEFKKNALGLVSNGRSVLSVSEALGIDKSLLYTWRRQQRVESGEPTDYKPTELEELRKRVMELEEERDILKKALSIFSRQT